MLLHEKKNITCCVCFVYVSVSHVIALCISRSKFNVLADFANHIANFEAEAAGQASKDQKMKVFADEISKQLTAINSFIRDSHCQCAVFAAQNVVDANLC